MPRRSNSVRKTRFCPFFDHWNWDALLYEMLFFFCLVNDKSIISMVTPAKNVSAIRIPIFEFLCPSFVHVIVSFCELPVARSVMTGSRRNDMQTNGVVSTAVTYA